MHICTHRDIHGHVCTYTYPNPHLHQHVHINIYRHRHIHLHMFACTCASTSAFTGAYPYTYACTYTKTNTDPYTHTSYNPQLRNPEPSTGITAALAGALANRRVKLAVGIKALCRDAWQETQVGQSPKRVLRNGCKQAIALLS